MVEHLLLVLMVTVQRGSPSLAAGFHVTQ